MSTIKLHMRSGGAILIEAKGRLYLWLTDGEIVPYESYIGGPPNLKSQLEIASASGNFSRVVDEYGNPAPEVDVEQLDEMGYPQFEHKQLDNGETVYVLSGKVEPPRDGN